ncbi:Transposon Tf2-1 polyprotein [Ceratobasidium sp. AG-Ba]|nr:Transposon Tf2-1 polyprotein [Ceratobasidium sp. AG-Ba]
MDCQILPECRYARSARILARFWQVQAETGTGTGTCIAGILRIFAPDFGKSGTPESGAASLTQGHHLANKKSVIAIDGKEIEDVISEKTELQIEVEGKTLRCDLYVMPLGDTEIILGKDWLDEAEPIIAWKDLTITYKDHASGKAATDEPVIPKEFADFLDLFQEEGFRELPPHREEFDCAIDLIEGAELPKPAKTYPMTPAESEALEKYIEQELKDGKIRRSQSSMAAPCFYVNKADGGLRLVVDYRKLNAITKPYRFPMPVQTELLEQLKAKIFSKMDIRWGFNNIRIREGDEWKTAFRTRWGTYETLVMPFGIINGPAYFQAYVNNIFKDLIGVNVVVYMDDTGLLEK